MHEPDTQLLTTEELAHRVNMKTAKATKRLMKRIGVEPIPLGLGAGMGDRWLWSEVLQGLKSLRRPKKEGNPAPRRSRTKAMTFFDKPYAEAKAELTQR